MTVIPEIIPGALFNAVADRLHELYPMSRKKAERAAVAVLETTIQFYEAAAREEDL